MRRGAALGISLLLHGAVAAWIVTREVTAPVVSPVKQPLPMQLYEWTQPEEAPPSSSTGSGTRGPSRRRISGSSRISFPAGTTDQPGAPVSDVPRAVNLTPTPSSFTLDAPPTTEADVVQSRVDDWAKSDVAQARTSNGLIAPEFEPLGKALKNATAHVPQFINTNDAADVGRAVFQGWAPGAESYGKTGSGYLEPEGRDENIERPTKLFEGEERLGDSRARNMLSFFAAGARLQEFADGRAGGTLSARVELKQNADGSLRSVTMLTPSGHPSFDRWVLEQTKNVAESWRFDGGTRETPARTVWKFDGVLTFRRSLKNAKDLTPRAVLGLVTMGMLSALSAANNNTAPFEPGGPVAPMGPRIPGVAGRFDERTGALEVVDLTNPSWACKVSLLEAQ
ncbi:MAG: energy transducer TonB family protein [Archangium sp.]